MGNYGLFVALVGARTGPAELTYPRSPKKIYKPFMKGNLAVLEYPNSEIPLSPQRPNPAA